MLIESIDLNCDMGEWHPETGENHDPEIMPFVSSCNIACGYHSGDAALMSKTIGHAKLHGLRIGAHPSYKDRMNFGRKSLDIARNELFNDIRYQIDHILSLCRLQDVTLSYIKPHGALYNDLHTNRELAIDFLAFFTEHYPGLHLMGMAGSALSRLCRDTLTGFIHEAFADRRYEDDGSLRSRQFEDAVIREDEAVLQQVGHILDGYVLSVSGKKLPLKADSICLHSDTLSAVAKAEKIHRFIKSLNLRIDAYS